MLRITKHWNNKFYYTVACHDNCRQLQTYIKPEAVITVFELLMMRVVSLETCCAITKHWNNKLYYTVAYCWLFLYELHFICMSPYPEFHCVFWSDRNFMCLHIYSSPVEKVLVSRRSTTIPTLAVSLWKLAKIREFTVVLLKQRTMSELS
jgi:hypothetical protein